MKARFAMNVLSPREQKALDIADRFRIVESSGKWLVPSQSSTKKYAVRVVGDSGDCDCPDFELRREAWKHLLAVRYIIQREQNPDGTTTVTETIQVTQRKTYPQKWAEYNAAQTTEKDHFQVLLADLCKSIETPIQEGRGQRKLPLADVVFAATYKTFSTLSGRRFMCDLREAKERGHVESAPHYNSIFRYLKNPELTPLLFDLIETSSLPIRSVETDFAADSSGFSTSRYERWFNHKYGHESFQRQWVKVHIMCGVKTNIITAVQIADKNAADAPMLPALVNATANNFKLAEVSADKGYLSSKNATAIQEVGARPYIAFKANSTDRDRGASKAYREMYHYFLWRRDEFLESYHKRSNVESTFSMMKRKFGDSLRSKTDTAMINESVCKILAHNISVLIHEIHELGIEPVFHN
jgi:transposase